MTKVIVIGLDGATWDLMKPWAEKGILPTFKRLMENGVYGNLESTIPPLTGPAWVSFATGRNPGKHGCYDFFIRRSSLNDMKPMTSKDIHGKTFYEILNENEKKCILINLPGSYPPRIKEIVITGLLTQSDNCIYPPALVDEIPELKDYRISQDASFRKGGDIKGFVNDLRKVEKTRFECAKKLFSKDWDFFFVMFCECDAMQHAMHNKLISGMIDENSYQIKAYKEMDEYIRWFVENAKNYNILFMSDHGFKTYKKMFFANEWLRREGYIKTEPKKEPQTRQERDKTELPFFLLKEKKALSKRMIIKIPGFLSNYLKWLTWFYPFYMKLKSVLPIEIQQQNVVQLKLSETIAYSIGTANFGGIYINDKKRFKEGKVEIDDYENIRTEIINKLKQLKNPETGENVIIKNVCKKEEVYFGSQLDVAPDIVFMLVDEYIVASSLFITKLFDDKFVDKMNTHALQGIFLAYGPDIKKGAEIQGAKIYDVAPTILHLMDVPVTKDMDGRVLKEIFKEDSEFSKKEIVYQKIDEKEMIKERIKKLRDMRKISHD